jgi:hypothetical protein
MYTKDQSGAKQPVVRNIQENYNSSRIVENYGSGKKEDRKWYNASSSSSSESYQAPAAASFGMGDKSWGFKEVKGGFRFY